MIENLLRALATSLRAFSDSLASASSQKETPQKTSSATPDGLAQMMATWIETQERQTRDWQETVLSILQGRPAERPSADEVPLTADAELIRLHKSSPDDLGPLSPGIEAIIAREDEESTRRTLLEERERLRRTLAEQVGALDRQGPSQDGSPI